MIPPSRYNRVIGEVRPLICVAMETVILGGKLTEVIGNL